MGLVLCPLQLLTCGASFILEKSNRGGGRTQAFKLFRERTGVEQHFWVHLKKSVPAGAGLGGGSGNAATALWAANIMCGTNLSDETLMEWSGDLGSDCPIFFSHGAAYCTGMITVLVIGHGTPRRYPVASPYHVGMDSTCGAGHAPPQGRNSKYFRSICF